ncbi:hypothetical protein JHK82_050614 [Glycine max]|nr:hypothetical protein JHK85_051327 [Glycine max]KAG5091836.1 hypothetical protein JHK82_050614 [Glycine max]KAG5094935.1 hypothetical protein JHK84_050523 [Glycine max]
MADRISNLPDVVLSHILSLVPTNVAVATSVLSKRWKLLWRSVSTLNFNHSHHDDNNHETCSLFAQRVHAFILMHDMDQPFTRFCLSSSCPLDPIHVNAWISAATQHRVEHLDLSLGCAVELPSFLLFSCKTLVVLKLLNVVLSFNNSCCVYLPRLKILHLSSVAFSKDRDLAQLLSGSPNLEDLEASDLMFKSYVVETEFRRLSNLLRAHIFTPEFPLEVVDNVQFLRINWKDHNGFTSEFQNLTHLEFFSYRGGFFVLDLIKRCPKLQILTIYKGRRGLRKNGLIGMQALRNGLHGLQTLWTRKVSLFNTHNTTSPNLHFSFSLCHYAMLVHYNPNLSQSQAPKEMILTKNHNTPRKQNDFPNCRPP